MTSCQPPPSTIPSTDSFWLALHRSRFLESLAAQGYAKRTITRFQYLTARLCAEAETRNLGPDALDAGTLSSLASTCPRTGTVYMERELAMVTRRFTGYLVHAGVIAPVTAPSPSAGSPEQLCTELDHWLRHHRGAFGNRLRAYQNVLKRFMTCCCTATGTSEDLTSITPAVILAFLDDHSGTGNWRLPYVRNILRFLFWSNSIPHDLSNVIPRLASSRKHSLPRHLEPGVIRMLLAATRGDRPRDLRDYAMLLLMVRLGLRAQEVLVIRLDDIEWGAGRMLIRGKGQQFDRMPIPVDVGEAIVAWLRAGRKGSSRYLFVTIRPPYAPFTSSLMIRSALSRAYRRADLTPPRGQVRTHALRHSLAMQLLHQGASLEEIGDVLRHRRAQSTTVYARYDLAALRPLARPWPVAGGVR